MVDNRSAGFFGIGGGFNFKSGDISGTAANMQDDKMGPGTEYGQIPDKEEDDSQNQNQFVDRSAQLRATLNSLAMMNVASVLNERKRSEVLDELDSKAKNKKSHDDSDERDELDEEFMNDFDDEDDDDEDDDEDGEYY